MQAAERAFRKLSLMCVLYTLFVVVALLCVCSTTEMSSVPTVRLSAAAYRIFVLFLFCWKIARALQRAYVCVRVFYFIRIFG